MLDEIYPRLLLELSADTLCLSELDTARILADFAEPAMARRAFGKLLQEMYANDPDSEIGLTFGQHLHPPTLCDFSRALMTADTFQDSLSLITRFHQIQQAGFYPMINDRGGRLSIAICFPFKQNVSLYQRRFCCEAIFSYALNALRETISPGIQARHLYFDYPAPKRLHRYEAHFNSPMTFDYPLSIMELDNSLVQRNLLSRDKVLHQIYLNKCLDSWRQSDRLQDFEYRAICCLMRHHPDTFNSHALADMLNISVRGLQKRLSKRGASFSSLATRVRKELTKLYLLQCRYDIDYTAEKLGFQTNSGFRRFFKAEFGQTPAEYLQRFIHPSN